MAKEINLRKEWKIDVIIEFDEEGKRLIIKKASGQVIVNLYQRDIKE